MSWTHSSTVFEFIATSLYYLCIDPLPSKNKSWKVFGSDRKQVHTLKICINVNSKPFSVCVCVCVCMHAHAHACVHTLIRLKFGTDYCNVRGKRWSERQFFCHWNSRQNMLWILSKWNFSFPDRETL